MAGKIKHLKSDAAPFVPATEAIIKLVGQPGLSDYLHFHKHRVVGGDDLNPRKLVDEWRRANDHYHQLETAEAGMADEITSTVLPKSLHAMKRALTADRFFKETFDTLPVTIRMVELRKLVISQSSVGTVFSASLLDALGKRPTPEKLFRFCLPLDRPLAPMRVQRINDEKYVFTSESTDFRAHNVDVILADQIRKLNSFGPVGAALVLPIGYGSNFLSAVQSEGRIVLQNGYHRAYALMSHGITHAPMIIQHVTRTDELQLAATSDVSDDPVFYFRSARPPLLKDFLDPMLGKPVEIYRLETRVEVDLKVRTTTCAIARPL